MTWWAQLLLTLAKPFTKLMAALGLYAKGRSDANMIRDLKEARAYQETMQEAINAPVHTDADAARQRMRNRDPRKP